MKRHLLATLAVVVCLSHDARATTFTINPTLSTISMSGTVAQATIQQQSAGSLTDSYTGTIDVAYAGSSLTINGANADAALHPASPFQPPDGTGGSTGVEDNYGIRAAIIPVILIADGAARDLTFSLSSSPISIIGATFNASQVNVTTTGGVMDYTAATLGSGFLPLSGNTSANQAPAGVFTIGAGGLATITIPIAYSQPFDVLDSDNNPNTFDSQLNLTGQLVATGVVPEPSSFVLAGVGLAILAARYLRRR
jgi:hypothetical protein